MSQVIENLIALMKLLSDEPNSFFKTRKHPFSFTRKHTLFVGMPRSCTGTFLVKEGGIQVLAGLVPSSQTVEFLFKTPCQQRGLKKMMTSN